MSTAYNCECRFKVEWEDLAPSLQARFKSIEESSNYSNIISSLNSKINSLQSTVNIIQNSILDYDNKLNNITNNIPKKVSDLINDSNYQTKDQIDKIINNITNSNNTTNNLLNQNITNINNQISNINESITNLNNSINKNNEDIKFNSNNIEFISNNLQNRVEITEIGDGLKFENGILSNNSSSNNNVDSPEGSISGSLYIDIQTVNVKHNDGTTITFRKPFKHKPSIFIYGEDYGTHALVNPLRSGWGQDTTINPGLTNTYVRIRIPVWCANLNGKSDLNYKHDVNENFTCVAIGVV